MAYQDAWETLHPGRRRAHLLAVQPAGTGQEMSLEPGRRIADCSLTLNEPVGGIWATDHFGLVAYLREPLKPVGTWLAREGSGKQW